MTNHRATPATTRAFRAVRLIAAITVATGLTVTACGGDDEGDAGTEAATQAETEAATQEAAGGAVIEITSFAFAGVTEVPAGSVITVVNNDTVSHTLTASDGSFDTGTLAPGDSAEITVGEAGTVTYSCQFHSSMTGSLTITG